MPLGEDALITWEYAKLHLGLRDEDGDQAVFEDIINAISQRANAIARRHLRRRTYPAIVVNGSGAPRLILSEYPVASIGRLLADPTRGFGDDREIPGTAYHLDAEAGIIELYLGRFPVAIATVRIEDLVAGYDPVPDDLQLAVLEGVDVTARRVKDHHSGVRSITAPNAITTQYELALPMTSIVVFESYRGARI
jgi:hypothetical protein